MEIKASAGELAYLMEEISGLSSVNIETDAEQTKGEVKQIMLDKLKEIAEIKTDNFINYLEICSVMNEIAKTLLNS